MAPPSASAILMNFNTFYQLENAYLPYNRNGVLFPRKIGDNFAMLSRPSDTGHTPFGDIFYSESPDMTYWGKHRYVFGTSKIAGWQAKKVGPGPTPIETDEGWLMIYHGVLNSCNGFVYRFGVALLDIDKPWIVKERGLFYVFGGRGTTSSPATCRTSRSRALRSPTQTPAASRSTTARRIPSRAWRSRRLTSCFPMRKYPHPVD